MSLVPEILQAPALGLGLLQFEALQLVGPQRSVHPAPSDQVGDGYPVWDAGDVYCLCGDPDGTPPVHKPGQGWRHGGQQWDAQHQGSDATLPDALVRLAPQPCPKQEVHAAEIAWLLQEHSSVRRAEALAQHLGVCRYCCLESTARGSDAQ
jgi:hypothetical protein